MECDNEDGDDAPEYRYAEKSQTDGDENCSVEDSTVFRLNTDADRIQPGPNDAHTSLIIDEPVTRIPFHAFRSWSRLESVVILSPTMDVGMSAFAECIFLKNVQMMSSTIIRLGASVFDGCTSLETITLSETCTLMELQKLTFRKCYALKDLRLPASLNTIMENCFENCTSLCQIDLPAGLTRLGACSFQGCSSLDSIAIPGLVIQIGALAFFACHSLKSVKLQEGLNSIADFAFGYCFALEGIQFPSTVGTIGFNCFASCTSLVTIELPPQLKRIDDGGKKPVQFICCLFGPIVPSLPCLVFSDCTGLKRVWAPPALDSIGYHAFRSCYNLVSITIPQDGNLSSVDSNALEGCTNLRSMALPPAANPSELTFSNCHNMIRRTKIDLLVEALHRRFEGLGVHGMCYSSDRDLTVTRLEDALAADSEESFMGRDKLGLNLLQVLLLSFNPKREVLIFFVKKHPTFLIPDSFGVRLTIDVAVHRVIDDLCHLNESSTIQDLLEVSLSHRVKMLGSQTWKNNINNLVGSLLSTPGFANRKNSILRILSKVESYERLETASLLELAVWKVALVLGCVSDPKTMSSAEREHIRVTNGSNVIIPQVAVFLWDVDVD